LEGFEMIIKGTKIAITIKIEIVKPDATAKTVYFSFLDDHRKIVFL
jgi:hypothetical protein